MKRLTTAQAVERLTAITGDDPEVAHGEADEILLQTVAPEVRAAYDALVERAAWWASA